GSFHDSPGKPEVGCPMSGRVCQTWDYRVYPLMFMHHIKHTHAHLHFWECQKISSATTAPATCTSSPAVAIICSRSWAHRTCVISSSKLWSKCVHGTASSFSAAS